MGEEAHTPAPDSDGPDWSRLWQWAYRLLRSKYAYDCRPADWEDMAGDAVLKVIVASAAGKVPSSGFDPWFCGLVHNEAIDHHRRETGRDGRRLNEPLEDAGEDVQLEGDLAQELATIDVQSLLDRTELEPHERLVLDYTYWYDLKSEEIAQILGGTTASTVRTWHRNALRKLREQAREV